MNNILKSIELLPTTCVSDALNGLNNMTSQIKPVKEELKLVGRAHTVKLRAADNKMVLKAIKEAKEGDILVIDAKGYEYNASCGDFVIGLAQVMGIKGVVLDGVVRDIQAIKELNYPVFCRGTTVAASDKHGTGEISVPITCGGAVVHPGDIIVGDADGVVVIPQEKEEEVLKKALDKLDKDTKRQQIALSSKEAALKYLEEILK